MALLEEKNQEWRKMYGLIVGILEEKPEFIEAQNKMVVMLLYNFYYPYIA
jgi:hypothetical protein